MVSGAPARFGDSIGTGARTALDMARLDDSIVAIIRHDRSLVS